MILNIHLKLSYSAPKHTTILIWTKKLGLYQFEKKIEKSNDWIVIIDESIEFGHEKLLVIYGIQESKIDFSRALTFKDLRPLTIAAKTSWTGELIKKEIEKIQEKFGKILYCVADGGNAIKKCLRLSQIPHIYDITHKIAWFLKQMYCQNEEFKNLTKKMAKMRGRLNLSNVSHILPPNQRVQSRFMNLDVISDWGVKVLAFLDKKETAKREYKELKWVEDYRMFIEELYEINKALKQIKHIIKTDSLSQQNIEKSEKILDQIKIKNTRIEYLKKEFMLYLLQTKELMKNKQRILATSDIIESSFGKYKQYINKNPMIGLTNLALSISAFTSQIDEEEIKQAMAKVKIYDLQKWTKENIGETNLSKRNKILKKVG